MGSNLWSDLKLCYRDSLKIALVVGIILSLINQYDFIFSGNIDLGHGVRIIMNFIVPFSVATYSRLQFIRKTRKQA